MLDYIVLNKKPHTTIDGESAIDLLYKTIDLDHSLNGKFLVVNEYYVARPDLISLAVYGTDQYADIICKVNGISNPFELNKDTVLFIPSYDTIVSIVDTNPKQVNDVVKVEDEDISTVFKVGNQKQRNESRIPNEQVVGDSNYIIDHSLGMVFY